MPATMATQPTGEPPQEPTEPSSQDAMAGPPSAQTVSGTVAYVTFTIRTATPTQPSPDEDEDQDQDQDGAPLQDPQQALLAATRSAADAAAAAGRAAQSAATAAAAGTQQNEARQAAREAIEEAQSARDQAESAERAARDARRAVRRGRLRAARSLLDDAELRNKLDSRRQQLEEELLAQFQKPFGRHVTVKLLAVSIGNSVEILAVIAGAVYVVGNYVQIVGGLRQAIEETRVAFRGIVRSLTGAALADEAVEARWRPGPALVELHAAEAEAFRPQPTPQPRQRTRARLLPMVDTALLVLLVVLVVTVLVVLVTRTR